MLDLFIAFFIGIQSIADIMMVVYLVNMNATLEMLWQGKNKQ